MGGRGSSSSRNTKTITPIKVDENWYYKPRENSQLYKNPITYAGNEKTKEVLSSVFGFEYEATSTEVVNVKLSDLMSVQAFVTKQGLDYATGEDKEVRAVKYKNQTYLLDGNHRVARALLNGKKYYKMRVTTIEKGKGN